MNRTNDSYIVALLCLGAVGGVGAKTLLDQLLASGVVEATPRLATATLAIGLFTAALFSFWDDEQTRYDAERS